MFEVFCVGRRPQEQGALPAEGGRVPDPSMCSLRLLGRPQHVGRQVLPPKLAARHHAAVCQAQLQQRHRVFGGASLLRVLQDENLDVRRAELLSRQRRAQADLGGLQTAPAHGSPGRRTWLTIGPLCAKTWDGGWLSGCCSVRGGHSATPGQGQQHGREQHTGRAAQAPAHAAAGLGCAIAKRLLGHIQLGVAFAGVGLFGANSSTLVTRSFSSSCCVGA